MNKIYKLIWDRTRQMYIAVSEIAKSHGKSKSSMLKKSVVACLMISLLAGNTYVPVEAYDLSLKQLQQLIKISMFDLSEFPKPNCDPDYLCAAEATGRGSLAIGPGASSRADGALAIGQAARAYHVDAVAIAPFAEVDGRGAVAVGVLAKATNMHSMALGYTAKATDERSVAIGSYSVADEKDTVAVGGTEWDYDLKKNVDFTRRITKVTDGLNNHDAATVGQLKAVAKYANMHYIHLNTAPPAPGQEGGSNYLNDGAKGIDSIAIGLKAKTDKMTDNRYQGDDSNQWQIAIGTESKAYGNGSVSLGFSTFSNRAGVSIGYACLLYTSDAADE